MSTSDQKPDQPLLPEPLPERAEGGDRRAFLMGAAAAATVAGLNGFPTTSSAAEDGQRNCECAQPTAKPPCQSCAEDALRNGGVVLEPNEACTCCERPTSEELKPYARVLLYATVNPDYREALLTFPGKSIADWNAYSKAERNAMLARTRRALELVLDYSPDGVEKRLKLNPKLEYVVLSNDQFTRGVFRKQCDSEKVLRLPKIAANDLKEISIVNVALDYERIKGDESGDYAPKIKYLANGEPKIMNLAVQLVSSSICGM